MSSSQLKLPRKGYGQSMLLKLIGGGEYKIGGGMGGEGVARYYN